MKTINKKESTPKNSKITKDQAKKSVEIKSSKKKLDPVVDDSPKNQKLRLEASQSLSRPEHGLEWVISREGHFESSVLYLSKDSQ